MAGRGRRSNSALKLTEEEAAGVKGAWRKSAKEVGNGVVAVGKLFSHEVGYGDDIALALGEVWCPTKGIRCKELGDNLFLFSFLEPGGKKIAISEGPWEFEGDLLVVADLDASKRLDELEFNFIPVWIRVLDLPIGLMNVETGEAIGESVGQILEVEADEDGSAVGWYLRIRVRIDIRKPLRRGVTMEGENGGEKFWCRFKYESLPNFCYNCGLLGHVARECERGHWWADDGQFGNWLRAAPTQFNPYSGCWDGRNSDSGGSRQLESRDRDGRSGERNSLSIEDSSHVNSESELRDEWNQYVDERVESLSVEEKGDEEHKSEAADGTFQEVAVGSFKDLQQGMVSFDGEKNMEADPKQHAADTVLERPGSKRGLESRMEEDKEERKKTRTVPGERTEDFPNIKAGLLSQSRPEN